MKLLITAAVLWIALIYHDVIERVYAKVVKAEGEGARQLEQRSELALHAAFYGSVVAVWLGFPHDSVHSVLVAVNWAGSCIWYARRLSVRIADIEEHEARVRWRKTAGMVRDIVKSEIAKATKAPGESSSGCK